MSLINRLEGNVGRAVQNAVKDVEGAPQSLAKDLIRTSDIINKVVDSFTRDPVQLLEGKAPGGLQSLLDLGLDAARDVLNVLYPQRFDDPRGDTFRSQSKAFRDTTTHVRDLQAKLASMDPSDPAYGATKAALDAASAQLTSLSGYSADSMPKPGTLWVDPEFGGASFPNGKITSSQFPVGTPVTNPEAPDALLFANGRSFTLNDAQGKPVTVHTMQEYQAVVAANRAATGMPVTNGDPISMHLAFEGGGGKGKRYGAAMEELYQQGVVPGSVTGASVGAIAAGLVAAGADPSEIDRFTKDPVISKFMDWDVSPDKGGVLDGKVAYDAIDQELRKLTGITDRPVTFADLKMPLQVIACKMSDTDPAGQKNLSDPKNRIFVFSQETTPNTPVALAIRASMAIEGAFDPVQMIDPTTGREVSLVDGGTLDNMPLGYNHDNLPTLGLTLYSRDSNHPQSATNTATPKPLPDGNLDSGHLLWDALNGYTLLQDAADGARQFKNRNNPPANTFMLNLPIWNLQNPSQADSTLGLSYDPKVDPAIDVQTRQVTQGFLRQFMGQLQTPGASGTNLTDRIPPNLQFIQPVTLNGQTYQASYAGGDTVTFTSASGGKTQVNIGKQQIEAMYLDNLAFGDLSAQLGQALADSMNGLSLLGIRA